MHTSTRRIAWLVTLGAVAAFAGCAAKPGPGGATSASASRDFVERTDAWHADRIRKLKAPDGWLSLVALEALNPGLNRVGRGSESNVRYDGFPVDRVGTFVLEGERIRFIAADGEGVEGVPSDGVIRTDASGDPTVLSLGDVRFHVIVRGGRPWVRIKDAAAPTLVNFEGLDRFPVDQDWRIVATFVPATRGQFIGMDTVIGVREEGAITGRAQFEHRGARVDAVLLEAGDGGSLLRFGDTTNGKDTYVIGRYLYVEPSSDGRTVVLDFNRAYNPPCALTAFATCTIPPESNEFPFDVNAGERWRNEAQAR
jgi:uncharacterized protein (DUF1684 family)